MTHDRPPEREEALVGDASRTTPWAFARERLANPEQSQTSWLATVRPNGQPHLMPIIAFWIDDAFHFVAGEGTRKAINLAADARCAIATSSTRLPSIDIVMEGRAEPLEDEAAVRRLAEVLRSNGWPLEVRGVELHGPHAPTAGPPPYRIFRMVPSRAFGLPGMAGMEQFAEDERPRPTRWEFAVD